MGVFQKKKVYLRRKSLVLQKWGLISVLFLGLTTAGAIYLTEDYTTSERKQASILNALHEIFSYKIGSIVLKKHENTQQAQQLAIGKTPNPGSQKN